MLQVQSLEVVHCRRSPPVEFICDNIIRRLLFTVRLRIRRRLLLLQQLLAVAITGWYFAQLVYHPVMVMPTDITFDQILIGGNTWTAIEVSTEDCGNFCMRPNRVHKNFQLAPEEVEPNSNLC